MNIFLLAGAGFVAGGMNALAGGGSFVSMPALMAAGVPSVDANASSTVALVPGGLTSSWAYRDGLGKASGIAPLRILLPITLVGGMLGALLLLWTPQAIFSFILPWLLLFATLALAFGRRFGESVRRGPPVKLGYILIIQFFLGLYGGYFGGAVGLMMLSIWTLLGAQDLKSLNGHRTLLVTAANAVAVLIFICARVVHWSETSIMLLAATAGGYAGAKLGQLLPSNIVRIGTLLLTSCITIAFFIKTYHLIR